MPLQQGLNFLVSSHKNPIEGITIRNLIPNSQCGIYKDLLSQFFDKNFTKATILLKKVVESRFHKIPFG